MTTSGIVTFSITRDVFLKDALIDAGLIGIAEVPESDIIEFAARKLNMLIKMHAVNGLKLWKNREFTLFLEDGVYEYDIGPSGDHATLSATKTEIKTAAVAGATSIDVDSTTGMTAADYIGIELDDGTFHWTTISSVTDSDTVVLASGIPTGDSVAIDNDVYFYTTKLIRPLEIFDCVIRDQRGNDRPIEITSNSEYMGLGSKTTEGEVNQLVFYPRTTNTIIRVYNTPSNSLDRIIGWARLPLEDLAAANDDFDIPQEWYLPLHLALAVLLTPASATDGIEFQKLKTMADKALEDVEGWDREQNTSMYLSPQINRN